MMKSSSLANLGVDVLINIMVFLRPPDIISLRQTCKALQASTMHRIVWIDALEQMMEEHHIPKATFPTASMDRKALEHTALSPAKFSSVMEKSVDNEIHPCSIRILPDHLSKQERLKYRIMSSMGYSEILLVPGGRFLLTSQVVLTPVGKIFLQLWDIGAEGQARVLVESFLEDSPIRLHSLSPMPDGNGFYLFSERLCNPQAIIVHKILAFGPFPSITHVNKQPIPDHVISHSISATRLVCVCYSGTIIVWNFEEQLLASWDSRVRPNADLPLSVHFYADNVLLYHSGQLMLWKIPEMHPDSQGAPLQHQRLSTFSALFEDPDDDDSDAEEDTYLLPQCPWTSGRAGSEFLGISKLSKFGLFRVQHLPRVPGDNIPSVLPSRTAIIPGFDLADVCAGVDMSALQLCNRRLMVSGLASDGNSVYIQMLPVLVDGSMVQPLPRKELFLRNQDLTTSSPQLCPATGRLCIVIGDTDIHILDYIQPPQHS
ncbi:hypothetical protein GALMADRAFT_1166102 [Galerina marginata CBS 339.88]|uniref:F-box domain-containing protein n=1 Tax=Galerina marginata (strain CBS 339.88) TaxID=685588 RepID=A0A067TIY2_GALM3|nr:hypothetical protein GALMADRAFT_1166102 [Galerina marginata CBS 339.88]